MDESNNWTLDPAELERAYNDAKSKCVPKAICVINPGKWSIGTMRPLHIEYGTNPNACQILKLHNFLNQQSHW